ncbi:MAG: serine protease [Candidatus Auribacterota bacterium]
MKFLNVFMFGIVLLLSFFVLSGCAVIINNPKPYGSLQRSDVISQHFECKKRDAIEGIWMLENSQYEIAIIKNDTDIMTEYDFLGIITDTNSLGWNTGEIKCALRRTVQPELFLGVYYMSDKRKINATFALNDKDHGNILVVKLQGRDINEKFFMARLYPDNNSGVHTVSGTGFFISDTLIATNFHVVADEDEVSVSFADGSSLPAKVVTRDKSNDLAILQISGDNIASIPQSVCPVVIGNVSSVREGDLVYTIGFPLPGTLGDTARITDGIINSKVGIENDPRFFQMSVAAHPGNSGGPLLNNRGQVIGVVSAVLDPVYTLVSHGVVPQNANFSIKITYLVNLLDQVKEDISVTSSDNAETMSGQQIMDVVRPAIVRIQR